MENSWKVDYIIWLDGDETSDKSAFVYTALHLHVSAGFSWWFPSSHHGMLLPSTLFLCGIAGWVFILLVSVVEYCWQLSSLKLT